MKHPTRIAILAGSAGLIALALVAIRGTHAQSATPDWVDQPAAESTIVATTTPTVTTTSPVNRHQKRLDAMAAELGITSAQLQTELQSGKEFYQIAAAHGMTYDKLKANHDAQIKARLDDMVKVGYLTQAEADAQWKLYQDSASQRPMMGMGFGHHRGFGM